LVITTIDKTHESCFPALGYEKYFIKEKVNTPEYWCHTDRVIVCKYIHILTEFQQIFEEE